MSKEYQQILENALSLPQKEFFALVQALLGKVQEKIWEESGSPRLSWESEEFFRELDRRVAEVRSGKVKPIPGKDVRDKLQKRMSGI